MFDNIIQNENILLSSLEELSKTDTIKLDYSLIPNEINSNKIQRYYKNIDSLWFSRVTVSDDEVYYYFGLKKDENFGGNNKIYPRLIVKLNNNESKSDFKFLKGGTVAILVKINTGYHKEINKTLNRNFTYRHSKKYPQHHNYIILGKNSNEILSNIEKLIQLVKFNLNIDNEFIQVEDLFKLEINEIKPEIDKKSEESNINKNSLNILKENLEIIRIKQIINQSNLNNEFKKDLNEFLFTKNEENDFEFNEDILKGNLSKNNLINILKDEILSFSSDSFDVKIFENILLSKIKNYYSAIEKPVKPSYIIPGINPDVQNNFPLKHPRDNQLETISEMVNAIEEGYKYIILEAGTGTGKSAMAATLANMYENTFILTVTKQLQDQYVQDFKEFGFMPVKGRSNFTCRQNHNITCDKGDCILKHRDCPYNTTEFNFDDNEKAFDKLYWKSENHCPYWQQKIDGLNSKIVVANYKYALYDFNFSQHFKKRKLLIMDEAHNLEDNIVDFVCLKFKLSALKRDLGFEPSSRELRILENSGYKDWLEFVTYITSKYVIHHREIIEEAKKANKDEAYIKDLEKRLSLIDKDYERFVSYIKDNPKNWLCYYNEYGGEISFKPAMIDKYANDYLLNKGDVCIFMSATILDYEKFASELGIDVSEVKFIHKDSPFDSSRNPIYSKNSVDMTFRYLSQNAPIAITILKGILAKHENDKGLVHVVSNNCRDYIMDNIIDSRLMTHTTENRDLKLKEFKESHNSVMVSPSMEEGVDLPDDECRFQVIFKLPRLPWGDKRIQAKSNLEPGWYNYRTAIRLVQMFGRGIRSKDDYCKTYVIDETFNSFIFGDMFGYNFIPEYMRNAIADNSLINPKGNFFENNDDVNYKLDYLPSTTPQDKLYKFDLKTIEISEKMRDFKKYFAYNDFFTEELLEGILKVIDEKIDDDVRKVGIVVVPSSTVERDNASSVRKCVNSIEKIFKEDKYQKFSKEIVNCRWLLYREKDVETSHLDSKNRPSREDHMNSIVCDKKTLAKLKDMVFILVDDITTTGTIMNACEDILVEHGMEKDKIFKFAIAKTVWWSNV